MKTTYKLLIMIGVIGTICFQMQLLAAPSLTKVTFSQQSVLYSRCILALKVDSLKNDNRAVDIEPSPDDFVQVEREPEPDYARLSTNTIYPEMARRAGIQGKVIIRVLIGKDGMPKPGKYKIEDSSHELFNQPTIDAVMKTPFTPALQKGQPIEVWVTVPMNFQLRDVQEAIEPKVDDSLNIDQEPIPNYAILSRNTIYPESARRTGQEGKVIVQVLLGKDGMPKPGKVSIKSSSNGIFNQAAIDAVMKTPFTPAIQKGQPIEVWVTVPMNFQLRNK
ncbi:MAG: energy transducer TonB [Ignavibacteria bacterium]|nr:energy transducer TonB [Ignavibacteria bacterium]